jgi:hypothetical protein
MDLYFENVSASQKLSTSIKCKHFNKISALHKNFGALRNSEALPEKLSTSRKFKHFKKS